MVRRSWTFVKLLFLQNLHTFCSRVISSAAYHTRTMWHFYYNTIWMLNVKKIRLYLLSLELCSKCSQKFGSICNSVIYNPTKWGVLLKWHVIIANAARAAYCAKIIENTMLLKRKHIGKIFLKTTSSDKKRSIKTNNSIEINSNLEMSQVYAIFVKFFICGMQNRLNRLSGFNWSSYIN